MDIEGADLQSAGLVEAFIRHHHLFVPDENRVVRLPHLMNGVLVVPAPISFDAVQAALNSQTYAELANVQILRAADSRDSGFRVHRETIFVLPRINSPQHMATGTADILADELYCMPPRDAFTYIRVIGEFLSSSGTLARAISAWARDASGGLASEADFFRSAATICDPSLLSAWVDRELAWGPISGMRMLEGWQAVADPLDRSHGFAHERLDGAADPSAGRRTRSIRAVPTRQLHITSDNVPAGLLFSATRGLALKSAITVKIPSGALIAGAALAAAMGLAAPQQALTRAACVVYWRGGDNRIENALLDRRNFDRLVVHGPAAVLSRVNARANAPKVIAFGPRNGISLISLGNQPNLLEIALLAVSDSLIADQHSCDASIVHFVVGSKDDVLRYADAVRAALAIWEELLPRVPAQIEIDRLRKWRRGMLSCAHWLYNGSASAPTSAVVVSWTDVPAWRPPMSRTILVRGLANHSEVLEKVDGAVGSVGIYPEASRLELRNRLLARGAYAVVPLGDVGLSYAGMPHDGLRPMSELVAWVSG